MQRGQHSFSSSSKGEGGMHFLTCIDVAGEAVKVGPGVKNFKAGDKVVAKVNTLTGGGLVELAVTIMESVTVARPPEVSAATAIGLPVAGLTAHQALTQPGGIKLDGSGQQANILITAASGIPWSTFEPNLSANGKVIDITPTLSSLLRVALKKLTFSKKQLMPLFLSPKADNLEYLIKLVKEGKLKTIIDSKYPLVLAEDAWAKISNGHATGKIIVEP
ncbi:quinone-oxidoreductase-like protein [Pyrus ussuriensis x Pyrus communis]|uniref:Quinone-oxidoreductase-like protein n=1 Tax=Pyrus ussuriensis x Pyrus communis TaxID=2448454 RepID=A0A5N5GFJ0_9ROSA|nr:quinone-oxidoreductase-like protein [Pyrus ussuriensis x Pyrus communis]